MGAGTQRILYKQQPATVNDGASFGDIVRYVAHHLRWTEVRAAIPVRCVLGAGIAFNKIERTPFGKYRLMQAKPPGLVCKVKETRTSSDDWSTGCSSESE